MNTNLIDRLKAWLVDHQSNLLSALDHPAPILLGDRIDPRNGTLHPLIVDPEYLRGHALFSGQTQKGKSRQGDALLLQLLDKGQQIILLDPHGTMFNFIRSYMVATGAFSDPAMFDKVLFVDLPEWTKQGFYPSFDVLRRDLPLQTVAVGFLEAVHRVWPELDASSALDTIVLFGCAVLIYHKLPITLLAKFINKKVFRDRLLETFPDEEIVSYWWEEFDYLEPRQKAIETGAIRRRLRRLTFEPELRYSLSNASGYNLIDIGKLLDQGTSLIVNLHFPTDLSSRLWGALLMVAIEQAVKARLGLPEEQRKPYTAFIDEFPLFVSKENSEEGFNTFLQRTLGAGFSMWLCHQNMSSVPESLQGALQNCGLRFCFQVFDDAEYAAKYFFKVDPHLVKHRVYGQGMPHTTFYSSEEQRTMHYQALMGLDFREAMLRLQDGWTGRIRTPDLNLPPDFDESQVAPINEYYRNTLFRTKEAIEADLQPRIEKAGVADLMAIERVKTVFGRSHGSRSEKSERAIEQPTSGIRKSDATITSNASPPPSVTEPPVQQKPSQDEDDQSIFKAPRRRR